MPDIVESKSGEFSQVLTFSQRLKNHILSLSIQYYCLQTERRISMETLILKHLLFYSKGFPSVEARLSAAARALVMQPASSTATCLAYQSDTNYSTPRYSQSVYRENVTELKVFHSSVSHIVATCQQQSNSSS